MKSCIRIPGVLLIVAIAGCSHLPQRLQLKAEDLGTVQQAIDGTKGIKNSDAVDQINWLIQDSETKCKDFIDSLFAQTAGTNVILDIVSTTASALGAVFTPLTTTHALSATSAISSGSKTSISTEYLNALSINHVTQAIQSTYGADMQKYIQFVQSIPDDKRSSAHVFDARSTLLTYHAECSLASAEGSIGNALQPGGGREEAAISVSYSVADGQTATQVASGILAAINGDTKFSAAGISAAEQGGSTPNGTLVLTVPSTKTLLQPSVVPSGAETVVINRGPPTTLQVAGTPRAGTVTISATVAPQAQAVSTAATAAAVKAPAPAVAGRSPH